MGASQGNPIPVEDGLVSTELRDRELPPAARRALAEAAARRAKGPTARPREIGGRGGADPVRYGDWEIKGLAVDF
jgi:hypothetical protein